QAIEGSNGWKMLCPAHKFLPVEDDLTFDDAGRLVSETITSPPAPLGNGQSFTNGARSLSAPPCTLLEMNGAGQATKAHCQISDFSLTDGTVVSGDRIDTRGFDDRGRFTIEASVEVSTYLVDAETLVTYDDAAGQRDVLFVNL